MKKKEYKGDYAIYPVREGFVVVYEWAGSPETGEYYAWNSPFESTELARARIDVVRQALREVKNKQTDYRENNPIIYID